MNNQSIKFLSVTIRNFRGVPDELVIPLDAPLTLIHAANGTGKSTICYALEWLLTNKVEDLRNTTDFSCQWGEGATSVSATCLIGGQNHELTRKGRSVWISRNGARREKIREKDLLELLTPRSVSGRTAQAIGKAKRGWLRNSRWLYSNSLSLLVDNNKAEERQQIFADILGLGHITSTLRELRDYRKELPSTKGLQDGVDRLIAEISELEIKLDEASPWKERAASHLSKIFEEFPKSQATGMLGEDFKSAQIQVKLFEQRVQHNIGIFQYLSEQWAQYNAWQSHLNTLRRTLAGLLEASETLSNDHSKLSADLSSAEVKADEGSSSVIWAKERLDVLSRWELITSVPSIVEYFSSGNFSQSQLQQHLVELSWTSDKQDAWLQSVSYLIQNSTTVVDLARQKQDLIRNVVQPPEDIVNITRRAEEAKEAKVKAESEFNALSSVLDKLRAMGWDIVHSHDGEHCPLCNHDWGSSEKLRQQVAGEQMLTPELKDAAQKLAEARRIEHDSLEKLTLANNQKASSEAYMDRLRAVDDELTSINKRTRYLEIMDVPDFSSFNVDNLSYLQSRIKAVIGLRHIFEKLAEVESVFKIAPLEGIGLRILTARENLIRHRDYYQVQEDQANSEKLRLTPLVRGIMENIQAKTREIDGVNSNIWAVSQNVGRFEAHWKEVVGEDPIMLDSYNSAIAKVEADRAQVDAFKTMLAECDAVVAIDLDSERLTRLKLEKEELSKKLEAGKNYITEADRTINRYTQHVRELTTYSLAPLLSPAAELFSRMHANEVYKDLSVSEGYEGLKWTVFAEGHEFALDAEEKFSQGQRQDLALSLYLARARNTGGSFFLDEPIAHLDDLNRVAMLDIFRLVATSMPNMNLILTTASDALARHMAQKFSSITDRHLLSTIELEGNPRTGITVSVTKNVPC
ncbi:MAG: AAA family ATPase [Pseudomonadota bacterium]